MRTFQVNHTLCSFSRNPDLHLELTRSQTAHSLSTAPLLFGCGHYCSSQYIFFNHYCAPENMPHVYHAACLSCTFLNSGCLQPEKICLFWLQSPVDFRANTLELLPRFAHPCDLFGLQSSVELREKFESICLVARPCDLFWLQTAVKFRAKTRELLPRFARRTIYLGFNIRPNLVQKQDRFYLASLGQAIDFGFNLRSHSEKNSKASGALRSAIRFIFASISGRIQCKTFQRFCIASLGPAIYFGSNRRSN